MATVNLGRIKFVWQGAYSGATAYVADDVVSYNGSSYICILASTGNLPTNATYWSQMSSAGTNGTDLTSTLTTQGDIVYRNASGLARLGAGTNGQVLTTAGAGANPSWSTVSAGFTSGTAVTGSGSVIDFTSIPATAKHIIVGIREVVTSDNGRLGVQLGTSSGITTSGYKGSGVYVYNSGANGQNHTNGFFTFSGSTAHVWNGIIEISNLNANVWVATSGLFLSDTERWDSGGGSISLASTLDRVRITTHTGGSINSGTINIKYI
jgi:hypothetical protein